MLVGKSGVLTGEKVGERSRSHLELDSPVCKHTENEANRCLQTGESSSKCDRLPSPTFSPVFAWTSLWA